MRSIKVTQMLPQSQYAISTTGLPAGATAGSIVAFSVKSLNQSPYTRLIQTMVTIPGYGLLLNRQQSVTPGSIGVTNDLSFQMPNSGVVVDCSLFYENLATGGAPGDGSFSFGDSYSQGVSVGSSLGSIETMMPMIMMIMMMAMILPMTKGLIEKKEKPAEVELADWELE